MTKKIAISLVALAAMISCTKNVENKLTVNSPFTFTHDVSLQGTEFVAKLNQDEITLSQLLSPSPALLELEQRINDTILKKVYSMAKDSDQITFGFAEPADGIKKTIDKEFNEKISVVFDPTMKNGIAKLNDTMISDADLYNNDILLSRLMTSRFEQSIRALEGLFARRRVLEASKAANVTMEQFIKDKILGGELSATDADVQAFAKKNNISEEELTENLQKQIKDTIVSNAREAKIIEYVAKNLISEPIKVSFSKPKMVVQLPSVDSTAPQVGEGPIAIVLFSRWDCDQCKDIATAVSDFVSSYQKYFKMNYVFNFPINSNEERMVSEASLCLKKQNPNYFWKFVNSFDAKANENIEDSVNQAVKASGGDFEAFRSCFLAREFKDQVEAHLQGTKDLGFYRTPVIVLDGQVIELPNSADFIESALALKAEKGLGFNLFYNIKKFFKNL